MTNKPATNFRRILDWHRAFGVPVAESPGFPSEDRIRLRCSLIAEEWGELRLAMEQRDLTEVADGIADLLYVVYGTAAEFGLDADALFAEVHDSNMSKLGEDGKPIYREDGKVLKGPHFRPPNLAPMLRNQQ